MRGLLSYRFLRRFAGDLKNRHNQPVSIFDDPILESDVDLMVWPDCSAFEEDCANQVSASDDLENKEEKTNRMKTKSRMSGFRRRRTNKCTAIALGGGGSRGALQIGALRALLEANIVPDLLVGTSIGAANATGLALWGVNLEGLSELERIWEQIAQEEVLDPQISKLIFRMMIGQPNDQTRKRVENYFNSLGITDGITFHMTPYARLALIGADLETGQAVIYGQNQGDCVLEGLLASIAVPPWFMPLQKDGRMIIDGGLVSSVPIEPALQMGATEIIALNLNDPTLIPKENLTVPQYFQKAHLASNRRHIQLETQIAEMQGVSVRSIDFQGLAKTPMWDFSDYQRLRQAGYEKAQMTIAEWN